MLYAEGFGHAPSASPLSFASTGCKARNRSRAPATRTSKGCLLNQRFASTKTSSARLRSAQRLASIKLSSRPSRMIARLVVMAPVRLLP